MGVYKALGMRLAGIITQAIDLLYLPLFSGVISLPIFRYGVCGVLNMALDAMWYFVIYHFIVCKQYVDFGFVVVSPHILSLIILFPITFFTGFWLNRNVAFRVEKFAYQGQLVRYLFSVVGSILLNYVFMKLLVEWVNVWPTPAKMMTTVICTVYSYLMGRYFTFKERNA